MFNTPAVALQAGVEWNEEFNVPGIDGYHVIFFTVSAGASHDSFPSLQDFIIPSCCQMCCLDVSAHLWQVLERETHAFLGQAVLPASDIFGLRRMRGVRCDSLGDAQIPRCCHNGDVCLAAVDHPWPAFEAKT